MDRGNRTRGSVLLMVVFVVALLAATVMGMLEINAEEIQVMQNEIWAAEALATAEAGVEDALMALRLDSNWNTGYSSKAFNGGTYTVTVDSHKTIKSTGTTARGYTCYVEADFTARPSLLVYAISINELRINE
jgi:type II secretory pathway component PulK